MSDPDYLNDWGLYDDTLLDIAFERFLGLSKSTDRFALFLSTVDTHHPDGYVARSCGAINFLNLYNDMLDSVKCADQLLSHFIEKIQKSPFSDRTLIVLVSDHLAMKNDAYSYLEKQERRNLFTIFHPKKTTPVVIDKEGVPFDIGPTVLHELGIETNIGLGRNLHIEKSLISKFVNFDQKLNEWEASILNFWDFPHVREESTVSTDGQTVTIDDKVYNLPLLFSFDRDTKKINPYFPFFTPGESLMSFLMALNANDKFIWIDDCHLINTIFPSRHQHEKCIAKGTKAGEVNVQPLLQNTNIDIESFLFSNVDTYEFRLSRLQKANEYMGRTTEDGIIFSEPFYPGFIEEVSGVSNQEEWGRWSDAKLSATVKLKFAFPLPKQFTIEIKLRPVIPSLKIPLVIAVGDKRKKVFLTSSEFKTYRIPFRTEEKEHIIELIPPVVSSPLEQGTSDDGRLLGLALVSLKVISDAPVDSRGGYAVMGNDRVIANSGGRIDGIDYSNSKEALDFSYSKGFRFFDLDIIQTRDGDFVAANSWPYWASITGYKGALPPSTMVFKKHKIHGKYSPLTMTEINAWFAGHTDATLITDKVNDVLGSKFFSS